MGDSSRPRVVVAVVALVTPLLAGLAVAVWALAVSPLRSAAPQEPLIGTVEAAQRHDATPTSLVLIPAARFAVTSQSSGTVTSLSMSVGEPVASGVPAMSVDGLPVVAYVSVAPLFRDIREGLEGADVETAQRLLVQLGHLDRVDGKAGASTVAAIRAFNDGHGYSDNGGVLAVGSLLWIPSGSAAPSSVTIRVGQLVAPQTELFNTTSGEDLIRVAAEAADADRILRAGPVETTLRAGQTDITDAEAVGALKSLLGDGTRMNATLESTTPRTVGTIPASAVVVGADGIACFFTGLQGPGTRIDAGSGSFGMVDVDAGLIGSAVLINPRVVREDVGCGS